MHKSVNTMFPRFIGEKGENMKNPNTLADVAIKLLFPNQKVSENFRKSFRNYVEQSYLSIGCVALYITEAPHLTVDFRNFMSNFPEMDCGKREVILTENGGVLYKENYHNQFTKTIVE